MSSNLTAFAFIAEGSEATPGLFNRALSQLSDNIQAAYAGTGLSLQSNATSGFLYAQQGVAIGTYPPSNTTTAGLQIGVNSNQSDYIYLTDSSNQRSNYVIGSRVGGTADGLNIWDASGLTMIASFSKQSIRFYQNVVGPVFDIGGALANTLNAGTFGTGADSKESRIQAAISQATASSVSRVYVPANMYPYSAASVIFSTAVQMVREGGDWSNYDVLAYGASTATAADSTDAFISAISGAGDGGLVHVPPGSYKITRSLVFDTSNFFGARIRGVSPGKTAIYSYLTGAARLFDFQGGSGQYSNAGIENLTLQSNSSYTATAIRCRGLTFGTFRNLRIFQFDKGIHLHNDLNGEFTEANTFADIGIDYCNANIDMSVNLGVNSFSRNKFSHVIGNVGDGQTGLSIQTTSFFYNGSIDLHFWLNGTAPILMECNGLGTDLLGPGITYETMGAAAPVIKGRGSFWCEGDLRGAGALTDNSASTVAWRHGVSFRNYHTPKTISNSGVTGYLGPLGTNNNDNGPWPSIQRIVSSGVESVGAVVFAASGNGFFLAETGFQQSESSGSLSLRINGDGTGIQLYKASSFSVFDRIGSHLGGFHQIDDNPAGIRTDFSVWAKSYIGTRVALSDGSKVTPDAQAGTYLTLSCSTSSRVMQAPSNPFDTRVLTFSIFNNTASVTTTSWPTTSYRLAGAWTDPAPGFYRNLSMIYDGGRALWLELYRTSSDLS